MHDAEKNKDQLIAELAALRHRITALDASETRDRQTAEELQAREVQLRHLLEGTGRGSLLPGITTPVATGIPNRAPADIPRGHEHILFVDDEAVLVRLGRAMLEHLGYSVTAYTSSLEALRAFRENPQQFDVVITDQTMPILTGATLVEELRRVQPDIPIILCTGFSHMMDAEKARALGVDAFVMKPGVTEELAVTIQQVLKKRARQKRW